MKKGPWNQKIESCEETFSCNWGKETFFFKVDRSLWGLVQLKQKIGTEKRRFQAPVFRRDH